MKKTAYQKLETYMSDMHHLSDALRILSWDRETYMPPKSGHIRGEQLSTLSSIYHQKITSPALQEMINAAKETMDDLGPWEKRNIELIENKYKKSTLFDDAFVRSFTLAVNRCFEAWETAKKNKSWHDVQAPLETLMGLYKEKANMLASLKKTDPYDALLDEYSLGCYQNIIDPAFSLLKEHLPDLIESALSKQSEKKSLTIDIPTQQKIARILAEKIGFDFTRGRMDISSHPFCGGTYGDVRMTTRYNENAPLESLMAIIHETGHAVYESSIPAEWASQLVGQPMGMAIHESQSLIMEMQASHSDPFLHFFTDLVNQEAQTNLDFETVRSVINHVEKGPIRIGVDEVTYPLHVIIRYEIEKNILNGNIAVKDIPFEWNKLYAETMDVTPADITKGCLQDILWFHGSFGYFPSYTLGAIIAAQLFQKATAETPDLSDQLSKGDFSGLRAWLQTNIHEKGSLYPTNELVRHVTGDNINANTLLQHLKNRYC